MKSHKLCLVFLPLAAACSSSHAQTPPPAIDPVAVQAATGATPQVTGSVVKVTFPRTDIPVTVDGWSNLPPFIGLTSYAAFTPDANAGTPATVAGDIALFQDEVNPVMSAALNNGLQVTALHNHFFYDNPKVYFMHIGGEGTVASLGAGVKAAIMAQANVRAQAAQPVDGFGGTPPVGTSQIDAAPLDTIFGVTGTTSSGMYKAAFPRTVMSSCCSLGGAMGIQTFAAFGGTNSNATVYGDFVVAANELQPVLKSLRGSGIWILSIHHHMTMEPAAMLVYLHYWGRGAASDLATKVKQAVDMTAWDGHK
jgi:hypothetical protein